MDASIPTRVWHRPRLISDARLRWAIVLGALVFLALAVASIEVNWQGLSEGIGRAARLFSGFLTPDFTSRWSDVRVGLIESLTMTVTSTVAGSCSPCR